MNGLTRNEAYRLAVIITIQLLLALIHVFRIGQFLNGTLYRLYYSYFLDIVVPFGFYFLLCINDRRLPFLRSWYVKSLIVFAAAAAAEILQFFGIYALGVTFDPFDILMYALGVALAALIDKQLFCRVFKFWKIESTPTEKD